jgi:alpha 1,6-mannosyltransferase
MSSRVRQFLLFIGAAFLVTSIVLLAIFDAPGTYRQVPRSVPHVTTTYYQSPIPPLIHQVFFFPEGARNTHYRPTKYQMSWQTSPFAYTFYSDAAALTLIQNHLPEYLSTFNALPTPILKTDFFKYAVLYVHGGIYSDLDVSLIHPLPWPELEKYDASMMVGIEGDNSLTGLSRGLQFESWTIAAVPKHPVLTCALNRVRDQTKHFLPKWSPLTDIEEIIMDWTGPGIWSDCVTEYIGQHETDRLHQLAEPRQIKDVLVLPRRSLGSLDGEELGDDVRGKHFFQGSWKKKSWLGRVLEPFN